MKKVIIIICCLSFAINSVGQVYTEGTHIVSSGHSVPNLLSLRFNIINDQVSETQRPLGPIFLKYDYVVTDVISIGMQFAYARTDIEYGIQYVDGNNQMVAGREGCTISNFSAYSNVDFYWLRRSRIALYSGVGIGYNKFTYSEFSDNPNFVTEDFGRNIRNAIPIGAQLTAFGLKVDIANGFGAYSNISIGKSIFELGLCYGFGGNRSNNR